MIEEALKELRPGARWNLSGATLAGLEWTDPVQLRPTDADILAKAEELRGRPSASDIASERARRLALGFQYDFGDARGVHRIGTTPADMIGWGEVSTFAGALLDSGDTTTTIAIVTDTGPCLVTAAEWRAVEIAAAAFRQPIWASSFVLMQSRPEDYASDAHWA